MKFCTFAAVSLAGLADAREPTPAPAVGPAYAGGEVDKGMSATSVKRLNSVIATLKDIFSSVQASEQTDAGNYRCFMDWCQKEIESNNASLSEARDQMDSQEVANKQAEAAIATLTAEMQKNRDEQSEVKETVDQATNLRIAEHEQYTEDSNLNSQSLNQVKNAIKIVGKVHQQGGFLQNGVLKRMQLNEPGESKYVVGIMKGLQERLETTKAEIGTSEEKKVGQYNQFMTTKKDQTLSLDDDYAEKQVTVNEKQVQRVEAQNGYTQAVKEEKDLAEYKVGVKERCEEKTSEWAIRSDDRHAEKAAIRQAISFLVQSGLDGAPGPAPASSSFLQIARASVTRHIATMGEPEEEDKDDVPVPVRRAPPAPPSFLQFADKDGAPPVAASVAAVLAQSADAQFAALVATVDSTSRKQGFSAAVKVVQDLQKVLNEQQTAESQKKVYCKTEIAKKEDDNITAVDKRDMIDATIQRKEAQIAQYEDQLKKLEATNTQAKATAGEAKSLRDKESVAYQAGSKDRGLAIKVIKQAKHVMKKFYATTDTTALSQMGKQHKVQQQPAPQATMAGRQSVPGQQVLILMDKIGEDIQKEQAAADKEEKGSQVDYNKFEQDTQDALEQRRVEIIDRTTRKAKASVQVNNNKEESSSLVQDISTISSQLTSLHTECDTLLTNFEKRQEARTFEIQQLRDVVDILNGADLAVRTGGAGVGMLQRPSAGQSSQQTPPQQTASGDQELAALQDLSSSIDGLQAKAQVLISR